VIEQRPPLLLQLKLLLRDVHPAVWRRVKLADSLSIADLHRVIQLLMGWDDDHLHRFRIHGRDYSIAYVGGPSFDEDAAAVRLAQFGFRPTERFHYEGRKAHPCENVR
jgi:Plasmid pRiA4b ORF-3-like protein